MQIWPSLEFHKLHVLIMYRVQLIVINILRGVEILISKFKGSDLPCNNIFEPTTRKYCHLKQYESCHSNKLPTNVICPLHIALSQTMEACLEIPRNTQKEDSLNSLEKASSHLPHDQGDNSN